MAWTAGDVTLVTSGSKADPVPTSQDTASVTPVANRLYLLATGTSTAGTDQTHPDAVTHAGGLAFAQVINGQYSGFPGGASLWWALAPSSGLSAAAIAMSFATDPPATLTWAVIEVRNQDVGLDLTDPIGVSDIFQGPSGTLPAFDSADSMTLCFIAARSGGGGVREPEATWTEIADVLETVGADNSLCVAYILADDPTIEYNHGAGDNAKVLGGVEIKEASAAVATSPPIRRAALPGLIGR